MADTKLVKSAGEHWVCGVLSRLGWAVALTRDGVARTDILGAHSATGQMIEVQVKAASFGTRLTFMLGEKGCDPARSDREWYVLVGLAKEAWDAPRAFVVPRDHVAAATWIGHTEWQTNPTVPVGKRNTGIKGARLADWVFARYEQRWDLLNRPASAVPVMLPPRFREWALSDRVGLRADHPWTGKLPAWEASQGSDAWPEWVVISE
ncbi:MAG: hypothetical protein WD271_07800 [Acidimicrobiia bacterium]